MLRRPMKPVQIDVSEIKNHEAFILQYKYDGLRATVQDGFLRTNSLKKFPNNALKFEFPECLEGLDGEIIYKDPLDKEAFRKSNSICMSIRKEIKDVTYIVYDRMIPKPFINRYDNISTLLSKHKEINGLKIEIAPIFYPGTEIKELIDLFVNQGHEGVILRSLSGWYKHGRTTKREDTMYKIKPFTDSEAVIIGFKEEMENLSPKEINNLGVSERKKSKFKLKGKGKLGAFIVRNREFGEFSVSASMPVEQKEFLWAIKKELVNKIITFKYLNVGIKNKPRSPIFKAIRDELDL